MSPFAMQTNRRELAATARERGLWGLPLIVVLTACGSGGAAGTSGTGSSSGDRGSAGSSGGSASGGGPAEQVDATTPNGADGPGGGGSGGQSDASAPEARPDASLAAGDAGGPQSVVTCVAGMTLPAGDTNASIEVGGTMRSYILHVPSSVTGQTPVPLVLDFHPILADDNYEATNSGYKALADQEGFVVAFPDGIDNAWNIGPCCTMSRTVDDLGFARALVTKIEGGGCIDPKRVYAVGYSMGGGMSHYLGCNAADVFASVAPAAFDLLEDSEEPCHPSRPITELSFRGTADPIVPYAGGASMPPNGLDVTIHFLGAVGTFQKWAQLDGCTGSPSAADSNGCSTYSQCSAGVEVTLCTTQGGGHVTGNPQIGWAMLKNHPMP
jgi:polyhydroxybutyrate depolymerase